MTALVQAGPLHGTGLFTAGSNKFQQLGRPACKEGCEAAVVPLALLQHEQVLAACSPCRLLLDAREHRFPGPCFGPRLRVGWKEGGNLDPLSVCLGMPALQRAASSPCFRHHAYGPCRAQP